VSHPAPEIAVEARPVADGWACQVTVTEDGRSTVHEVHVPSEDLARLAPAGTTPERLVEAAFRYLLAREPKESILRRFELSDIGRYFPGWERDVRASVGDEPERRIGQ
jgi:hypothetical protein